MILFINCCARENSRTKKLADALLQRLGAYTELNLYEEKLLPLNAARLSYRDALLSKKDLSDEIFACAKQFASADVIVIAAPYWDLSFPAGLKTYIENIYVTGIVSEYDENGMPRGLCRAKKLYYVTTAGGPYNPKYSYEYIRDMAVNFFGIQETELIAAEMLDIAGNNPDEILQHAVSKLIMPSSGKEI